jgi:hypothetical protein
MADYVCPPDWKSNRRTYPHPVDNNRFYTCNEHPETGEGVAFIFTCPEGLIYSADLGRCAFPGEE